MSPLLISARCKDFRLRIVKPWDREESLQHRRQNTRTTDASIVDRRCSMHGPDRAEETRWHGAAAGFQLVALLLMAADPTPTRSVLVREVGGGTVNIPQ